MTSTIESVRIIEDCLGGSWTERGCFARLPSGRGCSVHRLGGTGSPAATQIAAKSTGSRLAPPTSAPSMSGWARISRGVARLDRPAVEDPHAVGELVRVQLAQVRAERGAHLLRVFGGGDLAGADRPHRLVRDDQPLGLLGGHPGERPVELRVAVLEVPAAPAAPRASRRRTGSARCRCAAPPAASRSPARRPRGGTRAARSARRRRSCSPAWRASARRRRRCTRRSRAGTDPVRRSGSAPRRRRRASARCGCRRTAAARRPRPGASAPRQAEDQLLDQPDRLEVVVVHLPVAGDQRPAADDRGQLGGGLRHLRPLPERRHPAGPCPRGTPATRRRRWRCARTR